MEKKEIKQKRSRGSNKMKNKYRNLYWKNEMKHVNIPNQALIKTEITIKIPDNM